MKSINKNLKRILIVRTDRIGDVVLTTPVLDQLRRAYPHAQLTMLISDPTRDLVEGHLLIDQVMVDDRRREHKGILGFWRLVAQLRAKNFDIAFNFHTKRRTNLALFFAGIPQRIGWGVTKMGFLLTHSLPDTRHLGQQHEAEYCLGMLGVLGITPLAPKLSVALQSENEMWAEQWLAAQKISSKSLIVAIHPGASDPTKCWPTPKFVELITYLQRRWGAVIVLIGSKAVQVTAADIKLQCPKVLNLVGETTVGQMTSFLKRSFMLISNDSGPVHIGAALNIYVISLFLRNQPGINPERWRPLGPKSFVVANKPGEEVSLDDSCQVAAGKFDSIQTADVVAVMGPILANRKG